MKATLLGSFSSLLYNDRTALAILLRRRVLFAELLAALEEKNMGFGGMYHVVLPAG